MEGGVECFFTESRRGKRRKREDSSMICANSENVLLKPASPPRSPENHRGDAPQLAPIPSLWRMAPSLEREASSSLRGISSNLSFVERPSPELPAGGVSFASTVFSSASEEPINPLGLLVHASLGLFDVVDNDAVVATAVEVENAVPNTTGLVFYRRPKIDDPRQSWLVTQDLVSETQSEDLFDLYFTHLHRHLPLLSKARHTPASTLAYSPFVFTCVCAIASRYYRSAPLNSGWSAKCLATAKQEGFNALCRGHKSLDLIQGFLLLTKFHSEEDMSYQMSGIAIRLAMDLGLDKAAGRSSLNTGPSDWTHAQRQRHLEKTWLVLYITDHSVSAQMGKPRIIISEDELVRRVQDWNIGRDRRDNYQDYEDDTLVAMVELHRIVGRMIDALLEDTSSTSTSSHAASMTRLLIVSFVDQLDTWHTRWLAPRQISPESDVRASAFYYHYYKVLLYSFGVQRSTGLPDMTHGLSRNCRAAYEEARKAIMVAQNWHRRGWLTYALNPHFVTLSYIATYLLKFLSPLYAKMIPEDSIYPIVTSVIEMLEAAALDQFHAPALYAKFLRLLLKSKHASHHQSMEIEQVYAGSHPVPLDSRDGTLPWEASTTTVPPSPTDWSFFWDDMLLPGLNGAQMQLSGPGSITLSAPDGGSWCLDGF